MAIKKQIIITADTDQAVGEVNKLDKSLEKVGNESKKADSQLKKVGDNGGAIAVLDSLTGGLATRIRDAAEASKLFGATTKATTVATTAQAGATTAQAGATTSATAANTGFNLSLKATRTALIATGLGAFVVLLGTTIILWDDIIDAIDNVNGKLQDRIDASLRIQESLRTEISLLDKQIILLDKQGVSSEIIRKKRLESLNVLLRTNAKEIVALGLKAANLKAATLELNTREKILRSVMNTIAAGSGDAFLADKQNEAADEYLTLQETIKKAKEEQLDIEIKLFDLNNPDNKDPEKLGKLDKVTGSGAEDLSSDPVVDKETLRLKILLEKNQKFLDDRSAQEKKDAEAREAIEQAVADAKVDIADRTLSLIGALAKEGSAVGKAVAVAQATISGISGVQNAFTTASLSPITTVFPAYPFIQAGLAGAFSAIQIKKILSVDGSKGGSRGASTQSASGGGTSAPSFNLVEGTSSNQLQETIQQDRQPIEAFVISQNVTTSQELSRNIVRSNSIG